MANVSKRSLQFFFKVFFCHNFELLNITLPMPTGLLLSYSKFFIKNNFSLIINKTTNNNIKGKNKMLTFKNTKINTMNSTFNQKISCESSKVISIGYDNKIKIWDFLNKSFITKIYKKKSMKIVKLQSINQ